MHHADLDAVAEVIEGMGAQLRHVEGLLHDTYEGEDEELQDALENIESALAKLEQADLSS